MSLSTRLFAAWAAWTWAAFAFPLPGMASDAAQIARGEYVFQLSGCEGCHTDKKSEGSRLAGGRALKTDFGTFFSPNITPDQATGIGRWTFDDFRRAMREGVAPGGVNLFPAFPYTSYTRMTDQDLADLWAYLMAQPAVARPNTPHELQVPFGWRWLLPVWNWLYLERGPEAGMERGEYVAQALSHCAECHTPRNWLGGYDASMPYAGTPRNPEGIQVPNITPDPATGIGKWSDNDLNALFRFGMLPDGDFVGGVMSESVSHATSKMSPGDLAALIGYLRGLKPIVHRVKTEKARKSGGEEW